MFYFPIFFLAKQTSLSGSELFKENIIRSPCFFFVCLFVGLRPTREFFIHLETKITDEGLPMLTYTRHSRLLSSEAVLNRATPTVTLFMCL